MMNDFTRLNICGASGFVVIASNAGMLAWCACVAGAVFFYSCIKKGW